LDSLWQRRENYKREKGKRKMSTRRYVEGVTSDEAKGIEKMISGVIML
jgi:hypothetical protein